MHFIIKRRRMWTKIRRFRLFKRSIDVARGSLRLDFVAVHADVHMSQHVYTAVNAHLRVKREIREERGM